jgi:nucleoid DNA-binding protein
MAKKAPKKPLTKTEIVTAIAEQTDLTKKQVASVFEALNCVIKKSLGRSGAGMITIPGLLKIQKQKVPAKKARKNVPNPFKPGEFMDVKAKPASTKVKVRAMKGLTDMV